MFGEESGEGRLFRLPNFSLTNDIVFISNEHISKTGTYLSVETQMCVPCTYLQFASNVMLSLKVSVFQLIYFNFCIAVKFHKEQ